MKLADPIAAHNCFGRYAPRQRQLRLQRDAVIIDIGLVLAWLLHYAATTTLAGMSFFPLYAYAASEPEAINLWRRKLLLWTALAALISGLLWFIFAVANMSGSVGDLADPEIIWSVARDTGFGTVWTARMLLAVIIVGSAASFDGKRQPRFSHFTSCSCVVGVIGWHRPFTDRGGLGARSPRHIRRRTPSRCWRMAGRAGDARSHPLAGRARKGGRTEKQPGYASAALLGHGVSCSCDVDRIGTHQRMVSDRKPFQPVRNAVRETACCKTRPLCWHAGARHFKQVLDNSGAERDLDRSSERFEGLDCQTAQPCAR